MGELDGRVTWADVGNKLVCVRVVIATHGMCFAPLPFCSNYEFSSRLVTSISLPSRALLSRSFRHNRMLLTKGLLNGVSSLNSRLALQMHHFEVLD